MTNKNSDYLFAMKLQEKFNKDFDNIDDQRNDDIPDHLNATQNIAHPDWENVDPTPDIYSMFGAFDLKFFQGKLQCVALEWSKRMYSCAGICYSRKNQYGMQCTIRLSEPLLKLRSRKNLVETLLHEMIHAYLFILGIREQNGGHGPNFKKIMVGINRAAGTNITVYHTFHDEVALYKTHWWRCNGICQHRNPFFGYVRRISNRAPGQNDRWWLEHKKSCGGTFQKIKEPVKIHSTKKEIKSSIINKGTDIRTFFSNNNNSDFSKSNISNSDSSAIVVRSLSTSTTNHTRNLPSTSTGNLSNVVGFRNLTEQDAKNSSKIQSFTGFGHTLSAENQSQKIKSTTEKDNCLENVRSSWNKRFHNNEDNEKSGFAKRIKHNHENSWETLDDDLFMHNPKVDVIDISDSDSDIIVNHKNPIIKLKLSPDSNNKFLKDIHQSFMNDDEKDTIILIDGEYDDAIFDSGEISDTSVVDDFFGEDTLLKEFNKTNRLFSNNKDSDIIKCPICQVNMKRDSLSEHLDGCLGIIVKLEPHNSSSKNLRTLPFYNNIPQERKRILKSAGYGEAEIDNILGDGSTPNQVSNMIKLVNCPVCEDFIEEQKINEHVNVCLSKQD